MNIKWKAAELRRQLVSGQWSEESGQMALWIGWGGNFLLGWILASARILQNFGPFGVAITAQAGAGIGGLLCALGASVGYLLSFGFTRGIQYVSAVVLVFTAGYVFQELKLYKQTWFMPCLASLFTLLAGFLGAVDGMDLSSLVLPLLTETILAGGSAYFFRIALSAEPRQTEAAELRHGISLFLLAACVLIALARAELFGFLSLGRLAALLLVMAAACKGGPLSGAAAGIALGMAMDIAAGGTPCYSAAYAFSGLISGLFSRHRRLVFVLSSVLANAASVLWSARSGLQLTLLYDAFAASVVFVILPESVVNLLGAWLRPPQLSSGEAGLRRYTAQRLRRMSLAFQDLYDTVDARIGCERNDEDISKVFDSASHLVCARCKNKSACWNQSYMDTLSVFNDLTPVIESRGLITRGDLPEYFTEKCLYPNELVGAINGELRARMYRQQFKNRLVENRSAAYSQYAEVSAILQEVAEELQNCYGPDTLSQRRLDRFLSGINVDADTSVFRDRSGRMHMLIESASLYRLTRDEGYLDKLSAVVGTRLCRPRTETEGEGRLTLLEAEPLSVSVGIASMKKKGESVSGDRGTYFKTDRGMLCIILSDGMGSGDEAAKESVAAVRILERFLRSGVDAAVAMKMLNAMMLLKNGEEWGFATVDLMCVDLFTGETGFYKYGAAPSYVRSGRAVKRVRSESLAAGLTAGNGSSPDVVRMRLKPGTLALIASDGVVAGSDDAWLRTLLAGYTGEDTKALARETLQTALKQYGCSDDMTVLAVRIESRR